MFLFWFAIVLPRFMSACWCRLARVGRVVLLPDADADGRWPVHADTFPVVPRCHGIVVWLFPPAFCACVVLAGWMETVRETVPMLCGFSYWFATRPRPLSRNPPPPPPLPPPPPPPLPFGVFSLLAIALVSCAIWSDMVLICAAIALEDALELSWILAACSSWVTAACAISAMYFHNSSPASASVA